MNKIAFIVKGKKTEKVIIKSFMDNFMNSNNFDALDIEEIVLPMETNIYTLYKKMKEYDFFEDLDIINIIEEVFKSKGKSFDGYTKDTFGEIYLFFDYDRHANDVDNHDENNFIVKTSCLFDKRYEYSYDFYINNVFPRSIYDRQMDKFFNVNKNVMILSAVPEFIVDYLGRVVFEDNFNCNYCDKYRKK